MTQAKAAIWNVLISNGWDLNRTLMDHPNTELVRYSSPHCISILQPDPAKTGTFKIWIQNSPDFDVSDFGRVGIQIPTVIDSEYYLFPQ